MKKFFTGLLLGFVAGASVVLWFARPKAPFNLAAPQIHLPGVPVNLGTNQPPAEEEEKPVWGGVISN